MIDPIWGMDYLVLHGGNGKAYQQGAVSLKAMWTLNQAKRRNGISGRKPHPQVQRTEEEEFVELSLLKMSSLGPGYTDPMCHYPRIPLYPEPKRNQSCRKISTCHGWLVREAMTYTKHCVRCVQSEIWKEHM